MPKFKVRSAYGYDSDEVSKDHSIREWGDSLTIQSDAEDADINVIVKRFGVTGHLPQNVRAPTYGDFTQVIDFHSAQNAIRSATESFMELPAEIRAKFGNDPGAFVDFCSDPANKDELIKMGLAVPKEPRYSDSGVHTEDDDDAKPIGSTTGDAPEASGGRSGGDSRGAGGSADAGKSGSGGSRQGERPARPNPR